MHNLTTLDYALHYAALGIPVLPLQPRNKIPVGGLVPHGRNDATTDPGIIRQWFKGKPYNLGIVTGTESGLFVLDRDDKDGGDISLADLEAQHGTLPPTLVQQTGNGRHYVFQLPPGSAIRNSAKKIGPGLDIRGVGGYIVATPSVHPNGNVYQWLNCGMPTRDMIAPAPEWLLDLIEQGTAKPGTSQRQTTNAFSVLDGFQWPDKIEDGQGREDFIVRAAGHLRGTGATQASIERILLDYNQLHIEPPLDDETVLDRARRYEQPAANDPDGWPEPAKITSSLPPVQPFDERLLPPPFRPWVKDLAELMQCPVEYLAVGAVVAAGAVVGNRIAVQPKQHDTSWTEVPNLWGAIVGRPGVMKSPALGKVLAPLKRLESAMLASFAATKAQYEIDRMTYEATKKNIESQLKKGATILPHQLPVAPEEPQPPRLLLNDATYQKIGQVLSGNPHGVQIYQDELSGLLQRLDADGQEAARAFYLEAWNGQQSYTFDRIERGTVRIPRLCFSLLGGLQPSKLREYLRGAVFGGKSDDGLAQRLQLLVYPDIHADWQQVDRLPDFAASQAADAVFDRLAALDPIAVGAREVYIDSIPVLNFADDAQALFDQWREKLEKSLRSGDRHPALESHLSKYRKLVPALALLDHLIVGCPGPIPLASLKRAINWQRLLYTHAMRAYAAVTASAIDSAKSLSRHIERGDLQDGFTARDVYRKAWSLLATVKEATDAIEVLIDLGWLQARRDEKGITHDGRPTVRYYINPRLQAAA